MNMAVAIFIAPAVAPRDVPTIYSGDVKEMKFCGTASHAVLFFTESSFSLQYTQLIELTREE